eukprot:scaffold15547_cov21-Tisochrysis_lutea.AAC.4
MTQCEAVELSSSAPERSAGSPGFSYPPHRACAGRAVWDWAGERGGPWALGWEAGGGCLPPPQHHSPGAPSQVLVAFEQHQSLGRHWRLAVASSLRGNPMHVGTIKTQGRTRHMEGQDAHNACWDKSHVRTRHMVGEDTWKDKTCNTTHVGTIYVTYYMLSARHAYTYDPDRSDGDLE